MIILVSKDGQSLLGIHLMEDSIINLELEKTVASVPCSIDNHSISKNTALVMKSQKIMAARLSRKISICRTIPLVGKFQLFSLTVQNLTVHNLVKYQPDGEIPNQLNSFQQ